MANTDPRISVVLATFNGERFLEEQLASLACQTRAPHELIISDDGSTDRTNEIVDRFHEIARFPVVRLSNHPAKGFRENFLAATSLATGDWIAFCDQDDVWRHDKLEVCAAHMSTRGITQIAHQANLIDEHGHRIGYFAQGITGTALRKQLAYDVWGNFWGFSLLFDRRILNLVPPERRFVDYTDPGHLIAHDRWVFFLAQMLGDTFEIAEPLADYRQHGKNLFGNKDARERERSISRFRAVNLIYAAATRRMLVIVEELPSSAEKDFPSFDRKRAMDVFGRALKQLSERGKIYEGNRLVAMLRSLAMLVRGDYRNAQNDVWRWRSFAKDLLTSVKRVH